MITLTLSYAGHVQIHFNTVEANPQQENNFVFLSLFHSIFVIILPACLVSASQCRRVARKKPCAL